MDNTASVREVRDHLADVVDRASRDELTIITRRGREVAAVVPIELVHEWRRWEEERVVVVLDERMALTEPGVPLEEVIAETRSTQWPDEDPARGLCYDGWRLGD